MKDCECWAHRYHVVHVVGDKIYGHGQGSWDRYLKRVPPEKLITIPSSFYRHDDTAETLLARFRRYQTISERPLSEVLERVVGLAEDALDYKSEHLRGDTTHEADPEAARKEAQQQIEDDQHYIEVLRKKASKYHELVALIANMTKDGEEDENGESFEMTIDDTYDTLAELITAARKIMAD